jgi:hypothetical protein
MGIVLMFFVIGQTLETIGNRYIFQLPLMKLVELMDERNAKKARAQGGPVLRISLNYAAE